MKFVDRQARALAAALLLRHGRGANSFTASDVMYAYVRGHWTGFALGGAVTSGSLLAATMLVEWWQS